MSTPFQPDDDVDLGAVARDDALVEALRAGRLDALDDADAGLSALGALLADVSQDLPEPGVLAPRTAPAPVVVPLRRRTPAKLALVGVVGLGVLSVGGVAAAAPGSPLRPVRDAVAAAVEDVVEAVTPDSSFGPVQDEPADVAVASPTPSPTPSRPGSTPTRAGAPSTAAGSPSAVSVRPSSSGSAAVSRSRVAAGQVDKALDQAEAAIVAKRYPVADAALDRAARALPSVSTADGRTGLQRRYDLLRTRLDGLLADDAPATTRPTTPRPDKTKAAPTSKPERTGKAEPTPRPTKVKGTRAPRAVVTPKATAKAPKPTPKASRTASVPGLSEGRGKD